LISPFVVSSTGEVSPPHSSSSASSNSSAQSSSECDELRAQLRAGKLNDQLVELDVAESNTPTFSVLGGMGGLGGQGMEDMESQLRDMLGNIPGFRGKSKQRKVKVSEALRILVAEEALKLVDMDQVRREAIARTEQAGIVFIDEIDKIAGNGGHQGPDVSRQGVQRDLLPIVEGSTVSTKHGPVRTDHILFIAAGAFHVASVSDLIPELQGRFPIRVELDSLEKADFVRILTEPRNALTAQYVALLLAEGIALSFTPDAVEAIAEYAADANRRAENIGARRLHTVMEALLEELSFSASERVERSVTIDGAHVRKILDPILADADLSRFIL
jgi:ATP-dependent HslUV protease ATP-binding subunit HslU